MNGNSSKESRVRALIGHVDYFRVARAEAQGRAELPNLSIDRAFTFAASSSRFLGDEFVCSERRSRLDISAISSTAASNGASFVFDGLLKPLIFLTN
jgi:hypothetical protein